MTGWLSRLFCGYSEGGFTDHWTPPRELPPSWRPGGALTLLPGERFERIKPRIRWFEGGWWICQCDGTELGRGDSPSAAYENWISRL